MNADVEKAVEASRSPRVDALIERVMQKYPGVSASAQARYYEAVHQELAPLARNQEAEIAGLRADLGDADERAAMRNRERTEAVMRAEKAEALLRELLGSKWATAEYRDVVRRITAHLGGEHE